MAQVTAWSESKKFSSGMMKLANCTPFVFNSYVIIMGQLMTSGEREISGVPGMGV